MAGELPGKSCVDRQLVASESPDDGEQHSVELLASGQSGVGIAAGAGDRCVYTTCLRSHPRRDIERGMLSGLLDS